MKKCFTLFLSPSQGIHLLFVVVINVHLLTIKLKCLSLGSVCVCVCALLFSLWCLSIEWLFDRSKRCGESWLRFEFIYHMYIFARWHSVFFLSVVQLNWLVYLIVSMSLIRKARRIRFVRCIKMYVRWIEWVQHQRVLSACVALFSYNPWWRWTSCV